jgi:hypothetical protein
MSRVIQVLTEEKKRLERELSVVSKALASLGGTVGTKVKTVETKVKTMSAATRAKIAKAAKARWAKIKKA